MTKKENSNDIIVELFNSTLYYGKFDTVQCTWYFQKVTPIPAGGSSSPEKVVGDALYALSTADVQVSRDTGRTWQEDITGLGGDVLTDIALDSLQYVYGVSPTQLYKQHPDSSVWRKVVSFPTLFGTSISSVFVDRRNRIFVGASSNGIYSSTDDGNSWAADTAGMGKVQVLNLGDDAFGNIYAHLGYALFRSAGGTQPWVRIDAGLTALTGTGIVINDVRGDSLITAATSFGLFTSTDQGISWSDASQGLPADNITDLVRLSSGKTFVAAPRGIYFRNTTDTVWTKSYPPGTYQSGLTLTTDGVGNIYTIDVSFAGTQAFSGYPVKSTDEGVSWNLDTAGVSSLFSKGISPTNFYVDELGGQHASIWPGTSSWFPYKKTSGGMWVVDSTGMNIDPLSGDRQAALTGDGNGNIYCSNSNTGVFKRSVTGSVWSSDTAGLGTTYINRLCRGKNGDIYASGPGGNYYVRRGGAWTKLNAPPGVSIGVTPAISFDNAGTFLVAVKGGSPQIGKGVYFTKDDGANWTKAGLDSFNISKMVSYGDSTYIFTINRGAYILTTTGTTEIRTESQAPSQFVLSQNYPNPFNPSTKFEYSLESRRSVKLEVFNELGERVTTLVDGIVEPGKYQTSWNGRSSSGVVVASGTYFYRFSIDGVVQTKKMLMIK